MNAPTSPRNPRHQAREGTELESICDEIGGMSPVMVTGALLGNHSSPSRRPRRPPAVRAVEGRADMLNEVPIRGEGEQMPPTDPLIYRFYELVLVNGPAWKELIQEEFGDGIMSAIDFDMQMERLADPKGDRVEISCRAVPPFKYYGATGNAQPYGYKEE